MKGRPGPSTVLKCIRLGFLPAFPQATAAWGKGESGPFEATGHWFWTDPRRPQTSPWPSSQTRVYGGQVVNGALARVCLTVGPHARLVVIFPSCA